VAFALLSGPRREASAPAARARKRESGARKGASDSRFPAVIQPKLKVGDPDDKLEREADRIADAVMRLHSTEENPARPESMERTQVSSSNGSVRAKLQSTGPTVTARVRNLPTVSDARHGLRIRRSCSECEEELRRQPVDADEKEQDIGSVRGGRTLEVGPDLESRIDTLQGSGQPLPMVLRRFFEPRFGQDFADVRVHTTAGDAKVAEAVGARAFTIGRGIVFGAGQYAPGTSEGRRLLGHELTHTLQQSGRAHPSIHRSPEDGGLHGSPDRSELVPPDPRSQGTLPYRQATDLLECIRIMGEEDASFCRQEVLGEPPGSSSPPSPRPSRAFRIVLEDVASVGSVPRRKVEETIAEAFAPLARRAGRELDLGRRPPGDLLLSFGPGGGESRPCALLILGNEGGGDIFVGAHRDLRVCGLPERLPDPSGLGLSDEVSYAPQIERVFDDDEPEFGRFVGNTAVHELGHMIATLEHTNDPDNYMLSVGRTGANLPRERRNRTSMRFHWAGTKSFTSDQADRLVGAIRTGQYLGGMRVTPVSPSVPPLRTRPHGTLGRPRDTGASGSAGPRLPNRPIPPTSVLLRQPDSTGASFRPRPPVPALPPFSPPSIPLTPEQPEECPECAEVPHQIRHSGLADRTEYDAKQTTVVEKSCEGGTIRRQEAEAEEAERLGEEFREERRRDLSRIIAGLRFRKIHPDCPGGVALLEVLRQMRARVAATRSCVAFFQQRFGFGPERLFSENRPPTISVVPRMRGSGDSRCPSPSIRIRADVCRSPLRERVLMHELIHYAGCLTPAHVPTPESVVDSGTDVCMGTVEEALEAARRRSEGETSPAP